jgi:hypothetical protein
MNLDIVTEWWMFGVIAFGVIFYFTSRYYAQHIDDVNKRDF